MTRGAARVTGSYSNGGNFSGENWGFDFNVNPGTGGNGGYRYITY